MAEKINVMTLARFLALAVLIFVFVVPPWRASAPKEMPRGFGAAIGYGLGDAADLDRLGGVWYVDYDYRGAAFEHHPRLFLVETRADLSVVLIAARAHRGEWWQFGNEPNDRNQDNVSAIEYAKHYRDFYFGLKRIDPSARVVAAGIANADWEWADAFRESYRAQFGRYPRVDAWSVHNYLLDTCADATDAEKFKAHLVTFRDWMARRGETQPLLVTEYGVLSGNGCCECPLISPDAVVLFMRATTRWMIQSRAAQGWAWFAVRSRGRFNGDLFRNAELSVFGHAYRGLMLDANPTP